MPSFFYIVKSNNKLSIPWVETNSRFMLFSAMSFASLVNNSVPMPLIMNPEPWVGGLCQMLQFMFLWFNHFFLLTCCLMPIQIVSVCCFKIAFITAENLLFFGFAFMGFFRDLKTTVWTCSPPVRLQVALELVLANKCGIAFRTIKISFIMGPSLVFLQVKLGYFRYTTQITKEIHLSVGWLLL